MGITDSVTGAFSNFVQDLADDLFEGLIEKPLNEATDRIIGTPAPGDISDFPDFEPTSDPWASLHSDIYMAKIMPMVATLFLFSMGLVFLLNIYNERAKRKKALRKLALGFPLAIFWWQIGAFFLHFTDSLTDWLADGAGLGTIVANASGASSAGLALIFLYIFGFGIAFTVIAIYWIRWIAIHLYMQVMPVLIILWTFPIDAISGWAKSMMAKFVPLVFMVLPVAILLQISNVMFDATPANVSGATNAIFGFSTLLLAGLVPKFVFSFSSQVSSAVSSGVTASKAAAAGARSGRGPTSGGGGGSASAAGLMPGGTGSPSAGGSGGGGPGTQMDLEGNPASTGGGDQHSRTTDLNFKPPQKRTMRAQRAAKVGATARNLTEKVGKGAAKAGATGAKKAGESAAKNYYKDENMAKGMAKDAGKGTVSAAKSTGGAAMSKTEPAQKKTKDVTNYLNKTARRAKARQEEIRQEYSDSTEENSDSTESNRTRSSGSGDSGETGSGDSGETGSGGSPSGDESDDSSGTSSDGPQPNSESSRGAGGASGPSQFKPNIGGIGGSNTDATGDDNEEDGRMAWEENQTDRRIGSFGNSSSDRIADDSRDEESTTNPPENNERSSDDTPSGSEQSEDESSNDDLMGDGPDEGRDPNL